MGRPAWLIVLAMICGVVGNADPLQVHQFTLDNGLKVYFTRNTQSPEFYAEIGVRAGGKHESDEATGLAHYLEHLMFKGTKTLGTTNFAEEDKINQQIIEAYELRRAETETSKKAEWTAKIDQLSLQAARYVVLGEYNRLLSYYGQKRLNAHTSYEETVYKAGFPKNRFAQWAKLEADRFQNPVLERSFQWELETVYEEKNERFDKPQIALFFKTMELLFAGHPYGRSLIGTNDHLKNPSIKKMLEFYHQYYVPNNISITLSGDLDPSEVEVVIRREFSAWKAKPLPVLPKSDAHALGGRVLHELQAIAEPRVVIAYRFPGIADRDALGFELLSGILANGQAGLLDQLNRTQRLKSAVSKVTALPDYTLFALEADVMPQQTHEQVENILLETVASLREGGYSDELLVAFKNELRLREMVEFEDNAGRVKRIRAADMAGISWSQEFGKSARVRAMSKEELARIARRVFSDERLVIFRKKGSANPERIEKPKITPIAGKSATESSVHYLQALAEPVPDLQASFVDFDKDIERAEDGRAAYFRVGNPLNDVVQLDLNFEYGVNDSKAICFFIQGLDFAGTQEFDASALSREFYKLGITKSAECTRDSVRIRISGLEENLGRALQLVSQQLRAPKFEAGRFAAYKELVLQQRRNALENAETIMQAVRTSLLFGSQSQFLNILKDEEIKSLQEGEFNQKGKALLNAKMRVHFVGKQALADVQNLLNSQFAKAFAIRSTIGIKDRLIQLAVSERPKIYFYNRPDLKQAQVNVLVPGRVSAAGAESEEAKENFFNRYFGGGMGGVVFQEVREKRSLSYSPAAPYTVPRRSGDQKVLFASAATQSDKAGELLKVFRELIREVPWDTTAFEASRAGAVNAILNGKVGFRSVLDVHRDWTERGLSQDPRLAALSHFRNLQMVDVATHVKNTVSGNTPVVVIVGDSKIVDLEQFKTDYEIVYLKSGDIFGF